MATQVNHVFAKRVPSGSWWHETGHRDLADAQGDAQELRDSYGPRTITKILRGPDTFAWVEAKVAELNKGA